MKQFIFKQKNKFYKGAINIFAPSYYFFHQRSQSGNKLHAGSDVEYLFKIFTGNLDVAFLWGNPLTT
jgi:hypothetical protein